MPTGSYEKLMHTNLCTPLNWHWTERKKCVLKYSAIHESPVLTPFQALPQDKRNLEYLGGLHGKIKNIHHPLMHPLKYLLPRAGICCDSIWQCRTSGTQEWHLLPQQDPRPTAAALIATRQGEEHQQHAHSKQLSHYRLLASISFKSDSNNNLTKAAIHVYLENVKFSFKEGKSEVTDET